uniref:Uncharacterized protein n=1 Tax=Setaria italica TaxID=4555 RepID=K3Y4D0_SETIT
MGKKKLLLSSGLEYVLKERESILSSMLLWGNDENIFQRLFLRVINVIYLLIIPCTSV